ncbi:MAG: hypothetical protein J0H69_19485 [Burkholderiales bacterium]|nr:hypothetical protein [Burkholderiales bacterium]
MTLSLYARRAVLATVRSLVDAGGGGALLFYEGFPPAQPEMPPGGSPCFSIALAVPCGEVSDLDGFALLQLTVPRVNLVANTGIVGWARLVDAAGVGIRDWPVTDDPEEQYGLVMSQLQVYAGGEASLVSAAIYL